jgi:protein-L-isoaspartate(D-aspartate) O-methyltransferase
MNIPATARIDDHSLWHLPSPPGGWTTTVQVSNYTTGLRVTRILAGVMENHSMIRNLLVLALLAVAGEATAADASCVREHGAMIETIRAYALSEASLLGPHGIAESVLQAMGQTERRRFIPGASCSIAYADRPVPIGQEQSISQPFIVALMTHFATVKSDHTVLEIGTGSGYQAAILARLVRKVCTVEIIPPLGEAAAKLLTSLGYDNVSGKVGDGYHGWRECGPFDAIVVTAALEHVPPAADRAAQRWWPARHAGWARAGHPAAHHRREDRSGRDEDALRHAGPLRALYPVSELNGGGS